MKNIFSVRKVLTLCLLLSMVFVGVTAYWKITYWGFGFKPGASAKVWNIDAHISFVPTADTVKVSLALPKENEAFKILNENVTAKGYNISRTPQNDRLELTATNRKGLQNLYYRITIYDNEETRGKLREETKVHVKKPVYNEQEQQKVEEIWAAAEVFEGNPAQKIIALFNEQPLNPALNDFLPLKMNEKQRVEKMVELLAFKNIPARLARGVRLEEGKQEMAPDLMLEASDGHKWRLFNIYNGKAGLPKNFVVFQRGGVSLLDVVGGADSKVKFSVLKSTASSYKLAGHRAKLTDSAFAFEYSIYSLPLLAQNVLKWLMIFPLGILITVLMRNVVGLQTMGTFTPMLIALSLIKTGFWAGVICFGVIVFIGLLLRLMLSKLNLLLVPRISAVVIFVILIMQILTVIGFRADLTIASSAVFFPIIITAWIIERASIIWEEEGMLNTTKEICASMFTAIVTYFVISNNTIRHVMFAFNELNLVILFVVMLLGTYTGYRLTELKRFYPLAKGL